MPLSVSLVRHIWFIREVLIGTVEHMPEEKLGFTPADTCRSFLDIVLHVGNISRRNSNFLSGRTDQPPHGFELTLKSDLLAMLREEQQRTQEVLSGVTEAALAATYPLMMGERTGLDLVHLTLLHEADHHGNLVILAKLCGANPPDVLAVGRNFKILP